MTEEKKLSEVVIEQAHQVSLILKYVKNIELTNKLILKEFRNEKAERPGGSTNINVASSDTNISSVSIPNDIPTASIPPVATAVVPSVSTVDGKRLSVDQKVLFAANGKNLSLAPVEIFDSTNNLVKKTRTNTSGRWSAQLFPGKYRIHITKIGTKNKVIADMQYIITVDSSTKTLPEVKI